MQLCGEGGAGYHVVQRLQGIRRAFELNTVGGQVPLALPRAHASAERQVSAEITALQQRRDKVDRALGLKQPLECLRAGFRRGWE